MRPATGRFALHGFRRRAGILGATRYLLGQAYTRLGEADKARAQYQRFLDFRGDGELDAEWVADARRAVGRPGR